MTDHSSLKKLYYKQQKVVNSYEAKRFGNPSGQWIKATEENAIKEIIDDFAFPDRSTAIDLPAGTGRMFPLLDSKFNVVFAGDSSPAMIQLAVSKFGYKAVNCDAFHLPFNHETFDLILCARFVPHIQDLHRLLKEYQRVLKPNGLIIFDAYNWTPRAFLPGVQKFFGGQMFTHQKSEVSSICASLDLQVLKTVERFALPPVVYQWCPKVFIQIFENLFSDKFGMPKVRTYYGVVKSTG